MLNGADFVAVRRLSNKANQTLAAVGETCERVPAESLPELEASGIVRRVERAEKAEETKRRPRATKAAEGGE